VITASSFLFSPGAVPSTAAKVGLNSAQKIVRNRSAEKKREINLLLFKRALFLRQVQAHILLFFTETSGQKP